MALSVVARPVPVQLADWADANFYMSPESSYAEGEWATIPFQRAPLNMMGNDEIEELDIEKSARIGYTKMLMAATAYGAAHRKRNQITYLPTDDAAARFMKEHVNPMIRDVCPVREIASWLGKKNHPFNTLTDKTFDTRRKLWVLGGAAGKNFREKSADTVVMDELDGFDEDIDGEGRPDRLAAMRTQGSFYGKLICGSTPTDKTRSLITRRSASADCYLRCYLPCPDCGYWQHLVFENLILVDRGDWDSVRYACEACGSMLEQSDWYAAQSECVYRDTAARIQTRDGMAFTSLDGDPVSTPRHVAVHIWAAYSPMTTWSKIMRDFFTMKDDVTEFQTFWNQTLGRVWSKRRDAPPWKPLYDRSRTDGLQPNRLRDYVRLITAGVDVQHDRLAVEIVGWGEGKRSQSIDYRIIPGDTSSIGQDGPWEEIRRLVRDERWQHPSGAELMLSVTAIDSGDQTQIVYTFCREFQQPQVIPIKGSESQASILGVAKPVDVTVAGRKIRRGVNLWPLGVSLLKQEIYSFLKLERPTQESGNPLPPGWCEWPEYPEDYFQGLCSEQLVRTKNRRGYIVLAWEKVFERNEPLDCRNYARAGAALKGIDRWTAADWAALSESLGVTRPSVTNDASDIQHGVRFTKSAFWNGYPGDS